jgi:HEPN domain-containing protein
MIDPNRLFEILENAHQKAGIQTIAKDRYKAMDLLAKAKSDLKSCQILYGHGQYSDSVLFLQQASEKACKSFFLFFGLLPENDLKKVGHSSKKIMERAAQRGDAYTQIMGYFDPYPKGEKKISEIALATKESIMGDIADHEQEAKTILKNVEAWVRQLKESGHNAVDAEKVEKIARLERVLGPIFPVFSIVKFTSPHAESARYPVKSIEYTPKLGIVDAMPELIDILERAVRAIEVTFSNEHQIKYPSDNPLSWRKSS